MKLNCWQFRRCGREPGGMHTEELGVCPVCVEGKLDGVHGGKNAGRSCWVVLKNSCAEDIEDFALKYKECSACRFYKKVRAEENRNFELFPSLQKRLYGNGPKTQ